MRSPPRLLENIFSTNSLQIQGLFAKTGSVPLLTFNYTNWSILANSDAERAIVKLFRQH